METTLPNGQRGPPVAHHHHHEPNEQRKTEMQQQQQDGYFRYNPDVWQPAKSEGHLLVIEPWFIEPRVLTNQGKHTAIRAHVHDVTTDTSEHDVRIFGDALIQALDKHFRLSYALGRLERGEPSPVTPWQYDPPWRLVDVEDDGDAMQQCMDLVDDLFRTSGSPSMIEVELLEQRGPSAHPWHHEPNEPNEPKELT